MFDESTRFDAAEALSVLAHDYGLYRINTRLDEIRFSPRPSLERETLEETGEEFYRQWEPMARVETTCAGVRKESIGRAMAGLLGRGGD